MVQKTLFGIFVLKKYSFHLIIKNMYFTLTNDITVFGRSVLWLAEISQEQKPAL